MAQNSASLQLTFASLDAFGPCMNKLRVVGVSTLVEPSTTAGATAECSGFADSTTLGTRIATDYPQLTRLHRSFCGNVGDN